MSVAMTKNNKKKFKKMENMPMVFKLVSKL